MCLSLLAGCGKNIVETSEEISSEETTVEAVSEEATVENVSGDTSPYPLTITDQAGREVVIEKKVESIVSIYYITTSALIALDLKDKIVGIESNPEKRELYGKCATELYDVTQVGSPKELDLEACAAVKPDLVILPMRAKENVESLEELGINVMVVSPESQDDIIEMLCLIGEVTEHVDRAEKLTSYILEKTNALKEKTAECERPTVYLGGNSSFLSTASKGMYQNDLITMAGGANVAGEIDDTYWVESSYEQILDWNPEFIVMASQASYTEEEVLSDPGLKGCQAIDLERVFRIPSYCEDWDSPVPSSFLGAYYLAATLHPDLVTSEEYQGMVDEYYETFYGFSYKEY